MKRLLGGILLALLPLTAWAQGSIPPVNGAVVYATGGAWGTSTAPALTGLTLTGLGGGGSRCVTVDNGGVFGAATCSGGSITIPSASLLNGNGSILGSVALGTNLSLSGSFPNQTLNAAGGGGSISGLTAGQVGIAGSATTLTSSLPLSGTSGATQVASATSGSKTAGHQAVYDANGNLIDGGAPGSGGNVVAGGALTANQLMIGAGGVNTATLGSLGTTTTLLHGNASGAPTFGQVNLTNDTTGPVPVAQGGTGWIGGTQYSTVAAGGTGSSLVNVAPGTAGQVLTSNGGAAYPTYQASSTGSMFAATFGGTGTAYTATATGFTLTAGNGVQGTITTASGASPTLNVGGLGAKPIVFSTGVGTAAIGPGSIVNPTTTSFVYDGTNFVMQSAPFTGPPITASHTVTLGEWATCQPFAINTAAQTITLPIATSIPTGGCIQIQPQGVTVSLQPNGADGINGMSVGTPVTIPVGITTVVTTSGASGTGAFKVPAGPGQYFNIGWSTGQNLMTSGSSATNGIPFGRSLTPRTIYGVKCMIPLAAGGTASFDIYATASGAAPNAGSKVNTTPCDGNTAANTEQDMGVNTTQIPANYWFWLVATSWPTGTTSTGTGDVSVTFR